jgi:hypothetical protein
MAQETAEYLKLVREQVKDVENFWAFSLVCAISEALMVRTEKGS